MTHDDAYQIVTCRLDIASPQVRQECKQGYPTCSPACMLFPFQSQWACAIVYPDTITALLLSSHLRLLFAALGLRHDTNKTEIKT